jgi:cytochrome d ubiquinol oxidase subunit I
MIRLALDLRILLVPIQIFIGDQHGLNTLEHQPAKIAAIEGRYETVHPTPLTLFGIPDDAAETMRYAIEVPVLGSLILTHSTTEGIQGLKNWPADERPPVAFPFFAFRIMVGIALIMLAVAITGQVLLRQHERIFFTPWFLRLAQWVSPLGFVADRVRAHAHRGFRFAVPYRHRRGHFARALHCGLSHHVSDRRRVHGRAGAPRPGDCSR